MKTELTNPRPCYAMAVAWIADNVLADRDGWTRTQVEALECVDFAADLFGGNRRRVADDVMRLARLLPQTSRSLMLRGLAISRHRSQ